MMHLYGSYQYRLMALFAVTIATAAATKTGSCAWRVVVACGGTGIWTAYREIIRNGSCLGGESSRDTPTEPSSFNRGSHSNTSTHRTDFKLYPGHKPDVVIRRESLMRSEGLRKEHLFTHHGKTYSNNLISWYDEQFNKRLRGEGDKLPDLRSWDGHKLAWAPERSDYPMKGDPTNYGLHEKLKEKWTAELKAERMGHYSTDYSQAYMGHPSSAFPRRFASAPKYLSSHFNPISKLNKDLWLRKTPFNMAPEYPPTVPPPSV